MVRNVPLTATSTASQVQINYPFQFMVLNPVVKLVVPAEHDSVRRSRCIASALMRNES